MTGFSSSSLCWAAAWLKYWLHTAQMKGSAQLSNQSWSCGGYVTVSTLPFDGGAVAAKMLSESINHFSQILMPSGLCNAYVITTWFS